MIKLWKLWKERATSSQTEEKQMETLIVVGLGNPGSQYAHTRHNVGFEVTDLLCKRWNVRLDKKKLGGMLTETNYAGKRVVICQPQTFMNLSGECVIQLLNWYKVPLDHLLVVYDDIDLPVAQLRMRKSGSAGTHNGMRSIIANVPGQDFPRIRVGVGAPTPGWDLVHWVMGKCQTREEQAAMDDAFQRAAECVETWIESGTEAAMCKFNHK